MSDFSKRLLFWAPRVLCILVIAYLSLFALDAFQPGLGFWRSLAAFAIHLIPEAILALVLVLAWRWEWIGAALFGAVGLLYVYWAAGRPIPLSVKLNWILAIAGPVLAVAALFLINWVKRAEIRAR